MAQITLLYFAGVRTAIPSEPDSQVLDLPHTPFPLAKLRKHLCEVVHPDNEEFERVLYRSGWSVDEEMVDDDKEGEVLLKGGETVCPIPPVSGG
ncbi:hypothetical protein JCM11641_002467 [Rhodosporidiobolus odoratus]